MTVNVSKPVVNVREKLAELDKPTGVAGEAMLRAETPQEQQALLGNFGRRNLVHNGAMKVAQRATSQTGITSTSGYYTVDRWAYYSQNIGSLAYTMTQSSDAPDGFANSLKMECTTSQSSLHTQANVYVRQFFEGQDMQQIGFGTSGAKHLTISFWVKASKTGPYTLSIYRQDNVRTSGLAYYVNSANTWEYKTLTFNPDTTGALDDDNNASMQIAFFIASGTNLQSGTFTNGTFKPYSESEYAVDGQTNINISGDTWQITGVQLELGKVATPFEHRSYGEELALCQRYYEVFKRGSVGASVDDAYFTVGHAVANNRVESVYHYKVVKRAQPTVSFSGTVYASNSTGTGQACTNSNVTFDVWGTRSTAVNFNVDSGTPFNAGDASRNYIGQNSTFVFDAEL